MVRQRFQWWEERRIDKLIGQWRRDCALRRPSQFEHFDADEHVRRTVDSAIRLLGRGKISKAVKRLRAMGLGDLADGLIQAQQSFETRRGALTALEGELDEREAALAKLQITITDHAGSVEQAATALQELTGGVAAERLAQLQSALGQQRESLSEARASVARFEAAEEPAAGEEQRLASELEQNLAEQKEQQTLRRDERETARKLARKVKALKAEEDTKFRELKELRDRRDRLRDELAEARTTLAQREEFGRGRRHATDELKIEVATREPKLVEARQRLPEKAEQPPKIGGSEQLEGQRETLEGQRGRLGNVNMLSLEHYRQEEERLARIREDRKQLRREVRRREAREAKISARKLERFSEGYKHINENFQSTFTELTGGGKAWLELEKPETIFDGGVSIKARMLCQHSRHRVSGLW